MLEEKMKKLNKFSNKISRSEPVIGLDYNNFCYYFELQS